MRICGNCFSELNMNEDVCHVCGYPRTEREQESNALPEGTVLNGKYMIGKVLGEGGFGITYLAWDRNLKVKIAIKEYFPSYMITRNQQEKTTIQLFSSSKSKEFSEGLKRYVDEAAILAKLYHVPGIVDVKDFFYENGTGYIVMEYIDGISLKEYVKRKGNILSYEETLHIVKPIIEAMEIVHQNKLLHRDISPDNIMISNDGAVKLIDFGAARVFSDETEKSMTVVLKHGYAPLEQYSRNGKQGDWTDVYSLCAVMYRCLTGCCISDALDRTSDDSIVPISTYQKKIPPYIEHTITRGISLNARDRQQSMSELYQELYGGERISVAGEKKSAYRKVMFILITAILLLSVIVALIAGLSKGNKKPVQEEVKQDKFIERSEDSQESEQELVESEAPAADVEPETSGEPEVPVQTVYVVSSETYNGVTTEYENEYNPESRTITNKTDGILYIYDEKGQLIAQESYLDGVYCGGQTFTYYRNGQMKTNRYKFSGEQVGYYEEQFGEDGRRTGFVSYDDDMQLQGRGECTYSIYNDTTHKYNQISYDGNGNIERTSDYVREGNQAEELNYLSDGALESRWEYTYDDDGNITKICVYDGTGNIERTSIYEYESFDIILE